MSTEEPRLIIDSESKRLAEVLGSSVRYVVPPFHRDYSWGKGECEALWTDFLDLSPAVPSHFLGQIVLSPNGRNSYKLIDGQQRLVTTLLITLVAMKRFEKAAKRGENKEHNEYRVRYCRDRMTTIDVDTLERCPRIVMSHRNDPYFRELSKKCKIFRPSEHEGTNNKIFDSLRLLENKSNELDCDELAAKIEQMYHNLLLTVIIVNSMPSAFSVIERINTNGSQLEAAALIKDLLMEKISKESEKVGQVDDILADVDDRWEELLSVVKTNEISNYLRDIEMLNSAGKLVNMRNLFAKVRNRVSNKKAAEQYLDVLSEYATAYKVLCGHGNGRWIHRDRDFSASLDTFRDMKQLDIRLPISLFLAAVDRLSPEEFQGFTHTILVLTIRHIVVCDNPSRDLEKDYVAMAHKLKTGKTSPSGILRNLVAEYNPTDLVFRNNFMKLTAQKDKAGYFLKKIEAHVEEKPTDDIDVNKIVSSRANGYWKSTFRIEPSSSIKNSLANYYFVEADTGNGPVQDFDKFRHDNAKSKFSINRKIAAKRGWGKASIAAHQRWLAAQAVDVWKLEVA